MTPGTPPETPLSPTVTSVDVTRRFAPGTLVAGRYRIVSVQGMCGMGSLTARGTRNSEWTPPEVLRPELGSDPGSSSVRSEPRLARESPKNVVRFTTSASTRD